MILSFEQKENNIVKEKKMQVSSVMQLQLIKCMPTDCLQYYSNNIYAIPKTNILVKEQYISQ